MADFIAIRVSRDAKFAVDELKRKHAARMRRDLTISETVEAATLVADANPDQMDNALAAVLSAESGADS